MFSGKSLIGKEKAIQTADKEDLKLSPNPVFFISLVGVRGKGFVMKHEYIFDIYTKEYDFKGSSVKFISAHDLWDFYAANHKMEISWNFLKKKKISIYKLAEYFVEKHPNGNFVFDECSFREGKDKFFGILRTLYLELYSKSSYEWCLQI